MTDRKHKRLKVPLTEAAFTKLDQLRGDKSQSRLATEMLSEALNTIPPDEYLGNMDLRPKKKPSKPTAD